MSHEDSDVSWSSSSDPLRCLSVPVGALWMPMGASLHRASRRLLKVPGASWGVLETVMLLGTPLFIPYGASWCLWVLCGCQWVFHGDSRCLLVLLGASWRVMGTLILLVEPLLIFYGASRCL